MKDNFLIVSFFDKYWEITEIKADFTNKILKVIKISQLKNYGEPISRLKKFLSTAFFHQPYNLIFVFEPRLGTTFYNLVSLNRERPKSPIDGADLDNLVAQALWKFFEEGRRESAKQIGLNDFEILLSDVRVHDFKIDGRKIVNPLNHVGRKMDFYFSETFAKRAFFEDILLVIPRKAKLAFIAEGGTTASHLLSKNLRIQKLAFAKTTKEKTYLFISKENKISFSDYFEWGENNLIEAFSKTLKIVPETSRSVIVKFLKGEISSYLRKTLEKIFDEEIITLLRGLKIGSSPAKGIASRKPRINYDIPVGLDFPLLVDNSLTLPKIFPKMIIPVHLTKLVEDFGFKLINRTASSPDLFAIASLLEFYFLPQSESLSLINHLTQRRMRWLMP